MTPARILQINIIIMVAFFAPNANADKDNWVLWRQTVSSIMNSSQNVKSIAAFSTEAKCEAEKEKAISTSLAQLKAERVENSVVYKAGKITYSCAIEAKTNNKVSSKSSPNSYMRKTYAPGSKQNF